MLSLLRFPGREHARPAARAILVLGTALAVTAPIRPAVATAPPSPPASITHAQIASVLEGAIDAYNRGDFADYMRLYADRPDVLYVYRGSILRGKEAIAADFREKFFHDVPAGGRPRRDWLTIGIYRLDVLAGGDVLVTAVVTSVDAEMRQSTPAGASTLLMRRVGDRWVVVHEHTS